MAEYTNPKIEVQSKKILNKNYTIVNSLLVGTSERPEVKIADEANLYGVICSPLEIKMIKKVAPSLKCFTPGIRQEKKQNGQKRTMNAKQALEAGSDCLIIGRPITKGDPKKNIQEILSSLN